MINEWYLRQEFLRATQRWPQIVFFCLLGSLLGLFFSFIIPTQYRATAELYVGLKVEQTPDEKITKQFAGLKFRNIDDYKNWQMSSLASFIYRDKILQKTLLRLRELDDYWLSVDQAQLSTMLHAYWRSAGKWRLVAENQDPLYATQAVSIWRDVVVDQVHLAVKASQNSMVLDQQIQSLVLAHTWAIAQTAKLTEFRAFSQETSLDILKQANGQTLDADDRKILLDPFRSKNLGENWKPFRKDFPPPDALIKEYELWLERAIRSLDREIRIYQAKISAFESEQQRLVGQYNKTSQSSMGFSTDLVIEEISTDPPVLSKVRSTSLLILVGGLLGLLTWLTYWLIDMSIRAQV